MGCMRIILVAGDDGGGETEESASHALEDFIPAQ